MSKQEKNSRSTNNRAFRHPVPPNIKTAIDLYLYTKVPMSS